MILEPSIPLNDVLRRPSRGVWGHDNDLLRTHPACRAHAQGLGPQWEAMQTDHEVVPFLGVHRFKLSGMAAQALPHTANKQAESQWSNHPV